MRFSGVARPSMLVALAVASGCGLSALGGLAAGDAPGELDEAGRTDGSGIATEAGVADASEGGLGDDGSVNVSDAGPCAACGPGTAQALCVGGACVPTRRVFVSSTASDANLGGIAAADNRCQTLATAAKLGGTWRAWISSTASSPNSRFTKATVPYRLLDGTVVASSWSDLVDGLLAHGIDRDEKGVATAGVEVWSGTTSAGDYSGASCNGFTSNDGSGTVTATQGITNLTTVGWTSSYLQFCNRTNPRIYCFEQ
ncbi:MAG: hypothetical protein JST00_00845 [Deltaproteobacteria bacterium]|nr:hypothetical protein [Deltaproteobacteria bacterium]